MEQEPAASAAVGAAEKWCAMMNLTGSASEARRVSSCPIPGPSRGGGGGEGGWLIVQKHMRLDNNEPTVAEHRDCWELEYMQYGPNLESQASEQ